MGLFKSLNNAVNKVMKITDPIGGRLKEYTEKKSQAKVSSILGGLFGAPKPSTNNYEDLGGTTTQATSDEAMQSAKDKKVRDGKQRRQGYSGGSTLLTATEDEEQQLNKNTLLGM